MAFTSALDTGHIVTEKDRGEYAWWEICIFKKKKKPSSVPGVTLEC